MRIEMKLYPLPIALMIFGLALSGAQVMERSPLQQTDGGFAKIRGRVLPAPGEHTLPGIIQVTLKSRIRGLDRKVEVTSMGLFEFDNLGDGRYIVRAESPGYPPKEQSVIVAGSLRAEIVPVSIRMGRRQSDPQVPPPGSEKTISAENLSVPPKALREMEEAARASNSGDSAKAIEHLKKALEIHPEFPRAHTNLGVQFMRLGRWDDAANSFRSALELDPGDALAHGNLGAVYLKEGSHEEAIRSLRASLDLRPEESRTHAFLGEALYSLGKISDALAAFEKAYELDPGYSAVLLRQADCCIRLKKFGIAVEKLQSFLRTAPEDPRAEQVRAMIKKLLLIQESAPARIPLR